MTINNIFLKPIIVRIQNSFIYNVFILASHHYQITDNKIIRRCRPRCDPDCVNGRCIEATTCICNAGFQMRNGSRSHCEPVCSTPCLHGHCSAPNECTCDDGYARPTAANSTQCFKRCPAETGYEMSETGECTPICRNGCVNGQCVRPDVCECAVGYAASSPGAGDCVPKCDRPCTDGVCVAPNRCECNGGFVKAADGECRPVCNPVCVKGRCTAPGECSCDDGELLIGGDYIYLLYVLHFIINM